MLGSKVGAPVGEVDGLPLGNEVDGKCVGFFEGFDVEGSQVGYDVVG